MSWQEEYRQKLTSSAEAVDIIENGDRVVVPLTEQPIGLVNSLAERSDLDGVMVSISTSGFDPGGLLDAGHAVELENFIGPFARPYENDGRAPYLPLAFSLSFKTFDERPSEAKPIDVVMVTVTPPNDDGMVSFGPQPWFKRAYARRARKVIAEVNPNLMRTYGDCFLPVSAFDSLVEIEPPTVTKAVLKKAAEQFEGDYRREFEEMIELADPNRFAPLMSRLGSLDLKRIKTGWGIDEPTPEAKAIAEHVEKLIPHGASIQIGVGKPSFYLARLGVLDNKLELGLHTELVVPGVAKLVEAGVIDGSRKTLHRGKAVAVAWSGSDDADYAVIDDNPAFELYEPSYVLNPSVMARNSRQIGMNNALSVDLLGQINSESIFGGQMMNGIGGQPDAHLGALYSYGGRAITLLYSTAVNGAVSRIVPRLAEGEIVTIPRFWTDTIVTEYGVAKLVGKNHAERAEALIAIAHPDFRRELRRDAAKWLGE